MTAPDTFEIAQRTVSAAPTPEQVLGVLPRGRRGVMLESLHQAGEHGRFSIVGFDPAQTLPGRGGQPFTALGAELARKCAPEGALPFVGGWMGFFGYEAGRYLERLPGRAAEDLDLPRAWWGLYDSVAVLDRIEGRWLVAGLEWPAHIAASGWRAPLAQRLDEMERLLEAAQCFGPPAPVVRALAGFHLERDHYLSQVCEVQRQIRMGEIYQANLTRRVQVPFDGSGRDLYRRLRRCNPANFMAYLDGGDFEVLCSSPELFLRVHNRRVLTRPIKGTRPRSADPARDAAQGEALRRSDKDLAELAMIVDVLRNDLGRVCDEICATWPPVVESHPTVHHLVTDVRGVLHEHQTVADLLQATFPGGSVTGAPKIRAMEILDGLEPTARGPYCGTIGFIGLDGAATLNLAIRTMVVRSGSAYVHVGSGIVADSDPDLEYEELEAKALGMIAALSGHDPAGSQPAGSGREENAPRKPGG